MEAALLQEEDNSFRSDTVLVPETVTKSYSRSVSGSGSGFGSGLFSPVGSSWSGLSSPFGSELGSTETESEEEDDDEFIAELTRQMASYMLEEDDNEKDVQEFGTKKFRVSSECTGTPTAQHDLQPFVNNQEREIHLHKMENKPLSDCKQRVSKVTESKKPNKVNGEPGILGSAPAVWSPIQSPKQMNYNSGMRAVFLGGHTPKTKTSGTGVFLPRAATNPPEIRNKLGCSTVLIPARVLHTLQLHFEKVKNQTQSNGSSGLKSYPPQYDLKSTQAKQQSSQSRLTNKTHEICLPQEWTY